jgi:CHAT domain-containing protein
VDDATTAQLMGAFYRALQNGEGRAAALRAAQLELLALGREQPAEYGAYCHPAYWAPFVMIGEWGRLSGLPRGG